MRRRTIAIVAGTAAAIVLFECGGAGTSDGRQKCITHDKHGTVQETPCPKIKQDRKEPWG